MDAGALLDALRASVRSCIGEGRRIGVAYSGGLDSSIIAELSQETVGIRCYTCGVEGSFDASNAPSMAGLEGRSFAMILLRPYDVEGLCARTARLIKSPDPMRIAYTAPIVCVLEHANERVVLAGNGADELFGGYAKYIGASRPDELMAKDLAKARSEAVELTSVAVGMDKVLGFPFLSDLAVQAASEIPLVEKVSGGRRKIILREVAVSIGLPAPERPKKAAQYSSGILRCMEKLARERGVVLAEWTAELVDIAGNGQSH